MTTANPQRQCQLYRKFNTEKLPPPLSRRDERIRSMTCSFEEIAESEEEDVQVQFDRNAKYSDCHPLLLLLDNEASRSRAPILPIFFISPLL
ncbi:unnamed protein product [Angiostrongylus costaricensis]|uniref:Uncharacterized protein n=1 Tax=Angiostrongylus costaricensis TaxID=334426 RepID=A0A0R3Q196_ANGCS|nr:unnamed protein product [Angiostrongylus costaricensis]